MKTSTKKQLITLINWMSKEDYYGWDPYDGLNGGFSTKIKHSNPLSLLLIQFNFYSPLNFRKVLNISKMRSNKSISLIARAYLILYQTYKIETYRDEAIKLLNYLKEHTIIYNNKMSWVGNQFDYISIGHSSHPSTPTVVGTSEAVKTFCKAYEVLGDPNYLSIAGSAVDFMVKDLLAKKSNNYYIKYYPPEDNKLVVNASALALEAFSSYLKYDYSENLSDICKKLVETISSLQAEDGRWPYSYYFHNKFYYNQIDFHQGFIIEGLIAFLPNAENELKGQISEVIRKGASFYRNRQFTDEGISYYRVPLKYPVDIHNQAQGIITFTQLSQLDEKYKPFADKVLTWTLCHMQSPDGYFYIHRWPFFVNKIPYMRWGQAWMMLALSTYLYNCKVINKGEN